MCTKYMKGECGPDEHFSSNEIFVEGTANKYDNIILFVTSISPPYSCYCFIPHVRSAKILSTIIRFPQFRKYTFQANTFIRF